ncbi:MAG: hypothetical protein L6R38_000512 [Xanthoria sp. 2 TBL-2021]|nr:MAG: hypothetical protein L6R38_000512 [Xanthoria sp. 2 TBL-2021]
MAPGRRRTSRSTSLSASADSDVSSSEHESDQEFNGNCSRKRRRLSPADVQDTNPEPEAGLLPPISRIKPRSKSATGDVRPSELKKPTISNGKAVDASLSFATLGAAPWLITSLANMAITRPTGIQKGCIPKILEGRDVIGGSKTGSGKTVAFTVPILQTWAENPVGIFAVILTPTRLETEHTKR